MRTHHVVRQVRATPPADLDLGLTGGMPFSPHPDPKLTPTHQPHHSEKLQITTTSQIQDSFRDVFVLRLSYLEVNILSKYNNVWHFNIRFTLQVYLQYMCYRYRSAKLCDIRMSLIKDFTNLQFLYIYMYVS